MIDRLFTATLAFAVLAGASLAISEEFLSSRARLAAGAEVVQLPRVVITGRVQPERTALARAEPSGAQATSGAARPH